MKKTQNTISVWEIPTPSSEFTSKHSATDVDNWRKLVARVIEVASTNGWSKAEVSRRTGVPEGTFSQWASGKYPGLLSNQNTMVSNWLDGIETSQGMMSMMPVSPTFQRTSVGMDVFNTLLYTQVASGFTAVTLPAGSGKTASARHFVATRPHAYMMTLSPNSKNVFGMLVDLCAALDVQEHNPARFVRAIGKRLQRTGDGTILIVDEAQNAVPDAINQLRHFVDNYQCGVALLGNEDTAQAFVKEQGRSIASRAQVLSRFDRLVKKSRDPVGDAHLLIRAWGIEDPGCVQFLLGIASKPGSLRQIDRTMKGAMMIATEDGDELPTLSHLKAAWSNRELGDVI